MMITDIENDCYCKPSIHIEKEDIRIVLARFYVLRIPSTLLGVNFWQFWNAQQKLFSYFQILFVA